MQLTGMREYLMILLMEMIHIIKMNAILKILAISLQFEVNSMSKSIEISLVYLWMPLNPSLNKAKMMISL